MQTRSLPAVAILLACTPAAFGANVYTVVMGPGSVYPDEYERQQIASSYPLRDGRDFTGNLATPGAMSAAVELGPSSLGQQVPVLRASASLGGTPAPGLAADRQRIDQTLFNTIGASTRLFQAPFWDAALSLAQALDTLIITAPLPLPGMTLEADLVLRLNGSVLAPLPSSYPDDALASSSVYAAFRAFANDFSDPSDSRFAYLNVRANADAGVAGADFTRDGVPFVDSFAISEFTSYNFFNGGFRYNTGGFGTGTVDQELTLRIPFLSGQPVNTGFLLLCLVEIGTNGTLPVPGASCNFGQSVVVEGIKVVRDANGNVVNDWSVTSESGAFYGAPTAVIPVPAAALLFGSAVGVLAVMRRRRAT